MVSSLRPLSWGSLRAILQAKSYARPCVRAVILYVNVFGYGHMQETSAIKCFIGLGGKWKYTTLYQVAFFNSRFP